MKTPSFPSLYEAAREFVADKFPDRLPEDHPELILSVLNSMITHTLAVNIELQKEESGYVLNEKPTRYTRAKK